MTPLLRFEQVSKWYGPVLALNQTTLSLTAPITGLVGPNGSGKSTLIKLATGQIAPSLGRVLVKDRPAAHWRTHRLVGFCPDHDAFYEDLSGRQFIRELARLSGFDRRAASDRTDEVVDLVGMGDRADRPLRGYSKGMRQRIKLAQALLHDPELLILDEPLSGIDPIGRRELLELFRKLVAAGKQLLLSSHELESLERITKHVAIMARGRLVAVGPIDDIRELIDDEPRPVLLHCTQPRQLLKALLDLPSVLGAEVIAEGLIVRTKPPQQFYRDFAALAAITPVGVTRFEPLDESLHAVLGHILGGSGKT